MERLKSSALDVMKYPTTRYVTLAGMLTKFTDMAITCFIPIFFLRNFPSYKNTYAMLNALIIAILGFTSNLIGGIISDRTESSDPSVKGKICAWSSLIGVPLMVVCCAGINFWLSLFMVSLFILFTGS